MGHQVRTSFMFWLGLVLLAGCPASEKWDNPDDLHGDAVQVKTKITAGVGRMVDITYANAATADFSFACEKAACTYTCSVDGGEFAPCTSPHSVGGLGMGNHSFSVRGIIGGAAGKDAATANFSVCKLTESLDYNGLGADQQWNTADDIPFSRRVVLFEGDHAVGDTYYSSPGTDAVWGTADDVQSGRMEPIYSDAGVREKWLVFNSYGNDGAWNTTDDGISEYVVSAVDGLNRPGWRIYTGPGSDNEWKTEDDSQGRGSAFEFDEFGRIASLYVFTGAGSDNIWGTADDSVSEIWKYFYLADGAYWYATQNDASGNNQTAYEQAFFDGSGILTDEYYFNGVGADGKWYGDDDIATRRTHYTFRCAASQ